METGSEPHQASDGPTGHCSLRRRIFWLTGGAALCFALGGAVFWLVQNWDQPEELVFTPGGSQDQSELLVRRMIATNQPWLQPQQLRASYYFQRKCSTWSLHGAWRERLRRLHTSEKEVLGPLNARWKSPPDLRLGVNLETPLDAMSRPDSAFRVLPVGQAKWRGKAVVAVDIAFPVPAEGRVGMGVHGQYYSSSGYEARTARFLIDPVNALPLFIGTSTSTELGRHPRFESTFTFSPDFLHVRGGYAPGIVEWRRRDVTLSWLSRYHFQVTNDFWMFKRGTASIRIDRWSYLKQQLVMTQLQVERLRPGDLLQEYPTPLSAGDASAARARAWEFGGEDVFNVSRFSLAVGQELRLELGPADLGIGHCADGALWAVLIPRESATVTTRLQAAPEKPAHVWLRFHPMQVSRLFPPQTLSAEGNEKLVAQMCAIANVKTMSGWAAEGQATIPEPAQLLVDMDLKEGPRRCFEVDTQAQTARYNAEYEQRSVNLSPEAIEVMSEPLPDHRATLAQQARDSSRPRVVSVQPTPGASGVNPRTELRVRFDRPMDPLAAKINWESGDFVACEFPRYDSNTFEFVFPIHLAGGVLHQLAINKDELGFGEWGFLTPDGKLAALYVWRFTTEKESGAVSGAATQAVPAASPNRKDSQPGQDPQLLSLLQRMQQRQSAVTSCFERVQELAPHHRRGMRKLSLQGSTFKWQQPGQYYGDVSQVVSGLLRIGCDGQNWWWESDSSAVPDLCLCPTKSMQLLNISLADPFSLSSDPPSNAIINLGLIYAGLTNRAGVQYHLVEAGAGGPSTNSGPRWWIDANTWLIAEIEDQGRRTRFLYEAVNQPLPKAEFAPPALSRAKIQPLDPLDAGYTQRFVNLRDGADGRMSVRWGKVGPKGRSSSGLN